MTQPPASDSPSPYPPGGAGPAPYGAPPHFGAVPGGPPLPPPPPPPPGGRPPFGLLVSALGTVALLVGMSALAWVSFDSSELAGPGSSELRLYQVASLMADPSADFNGFYRAVLEHLLWPAAAMAMAMAAAAGWPLAAAGRRIGPRCAGAVFALFGLGATIGCVVELNKLLEDAPASLGLGIWFAVGGYAALALGSALGPPRAPYQ